VREKKVARQKKIIVEVLSSCRRKLVFTVFFAMKKVEIVEKFKFIIVLKTSRRHTQKTGALEPFLRLKLAETCVGHLLDFYHQIPNVDELDMSSVELFQGRIFNE
jgi:hypothetical protein